MTLKKRKQRMLLINEELAGVENTLLRMIFTLRYVDCFTWPQVAALIGGGHTAANVSLHVYRCKNEKLQALSKE